MDECFVFCWYACTRGHHMHAWCPWRVGHVVIRVSGTGIVCEPPWSAGTDLSSLQEQQGPLTAEPALLLFCFM